MFTPTQYRGLDNPEDNSNSLNTMGKPTMKERIMFAGGAAAYATKCTFTQLKNKISKKKKSTDSSTHENPAEFD